MSYLQSLLRELCALSQETEWVEAGLIRLYDPNANRKAYRCLPSWA
ncbi:hypothetical protein [Pseudomonas azerbaijanorientalis]|nr:hypothetical protein [Pseudomonas azerbaijanorientalis]QXH64703.1 hypothetical protein KSS91_04140 [Pseudomonas azerbaijanorientalis]